MASTRLYGGSITQLGKTIKKFGWLCTFVDVDDHQSREIDNLLVRIHLIIVMIRWTGLAPWDCELPVPGSLTSTFPVDVDDHQAPCYHSGEAVLFKLTNASAF